MDKFSIKKIMLVLVFLLVSGSISTVYAINEPQKMQSNDGTLEDYEYLIDERQKLQYDDLPSNLKQG